jgi:hypothetical protein
MPKITDAVKYLDQDLRKAIKNDVLDVALFFSRPRRRKQAGYFCIPKLVFTLSEFLGYIAYGGTRKKSEAQDGVKFLEVYFKYSEYPNLIFNMWRHGTVHRFSPDIFEHKIRGKKIIVGWMSNKDRGRGNQSANTEAFNFIEHPNTIVININIYKLAKDLLKALDKFIVDIKGGKVSASDCCMRLNYALGPTVPTGKAVDEIKLLWNLYENGKLKQVDKNGRRPK